MVLSSNPLLPLKYDGGLRISWYERTFVYKHLINIFVGHRQNYAIRYAICKTNGNS